MTDERLPEGAVEFDRILTELFQQALDWYKNNLLIDEPMIVEGAE